MVAARRSLAAVELLLVMPGTLFMLSLFLRAVQPALQTGRVVNWFAHHLVLGLYLSLMSMPLAALVIGGTVVLRTWRKDGELHAAVSAMLEVAGRYGAMLLIVVATAFAAVILFLVGLHRLTH